MNKKNHYQILEIAHNATFDQIKTAYRKLVKKFHPDVYKADDATEKITIINEAYQILSDHNKRTEYDNSLLIHMNFRFDQNGFDFENLFNNDFQDFDNFAAERKEKSFKQQNIDEEQRIKTQKVDDLHKYEADYQVETQSIQDDLFDSSWINKDHEVFFDQPKVNHDNNPFKVHVAKSIIDKFAKAFEMEWNLVLEILGKNKLDKKEIYLRCYHNQHYFNYSKLSAKELTAENFHKNILNLSTDYHNFINQFKKEKKRLDLISDFYFDEVFLTENFKKIFRYCRLFECNFCSQSIIGNPNYQCNFCFNKRFLKEQMAIQIAWNNGQVPHGPLIFYNFGNRNDEFIGNLIVHLIPIKKETVGNKKSFLVIDYQKNNFKIDEIIENKVL